MPVVRNDPEGKESGAINTPELAPTAAQGPTDDPSPKTRQGPEDEFHAKPSVPSEVNGSLIIVRLVTTPELARLFSVNVKLTLLTVVTAY